MAPDNYSVFDLMDDIDRMNKRKAAAEKIAQMSYFERLFLLGLLQHEESADGQAGVDRVIGWIANREEHTT